MKGQTIDLGTLDIDIKCIEANPEQPRVVFDPIKLQELADSIRDNGLLQSIVVRKIAENKYVIIAGERRFRAHKLLTKPLIKARVIQCDDRTAYELTLLENIVRQDLDLLEEARGYHHLKTKYNYTLDELAKVSSKSKSNISNICSILKEDKKIQEYIKDGTLTLAAYVWIKQLPSLNEKVGLLDRVRKGEVKRTDIRKYVENIVNTYAIAEKLGVDPLELRKKGTERGMRGRYDVKEKSIFPIDFSFYFSADYNLSAEDIDFLPSPNIIFSAYYFMYDKAASKRLALILLNKDKIEKSLMDSGVMPAARRKHWKFFQEVKKLCEFYDFIQPDSCVSMDVPMYPFVLDNWKITKQEMMNLTLKNAKEFLQWVPKYKTTKIFPLQGSTPEEYLECFYKYEKMGVWDAKDTTFGFGGIATTSGKNQIDIISHVMSDSGVIKKKDTVPFIHGFGVGNPQRITDLYNLGVNSFDSLTTMLLTATGQYWLRNGKQAKHIIHEFPLTRHIRLHFNMISFWGQLAEIFASSKGEKLTDIVEKIDLKGLER